MDELDLDDLEEYLLDASFEEVGTKPEELPDNYFAQVEPLLAQHFTECIEQIVLHGKLSAVNFPDSTNYLPTLTVQSDGSLDFTFPWTRAPKEQLKHPEDSWKLPNFPNFTMDSLESILSEPAGAGIETSLPSALDLLDSFQPETHPLLPHIKQKVQPETFEEDDLDNILAIPDLTIATDTYAIIDEQDVTNFAELVPHPAMVHSFELDVFQKRAAFRIESNQNVFVAAHTSAGKTVVAEYAIALCKHRLSRVIYTSPIKALSNQKFREFKDVFQDVGILTGDVSVDPDAACVIMTTEILRSMLYNNSSRVRDLEWVILDEVHYINDQERGVVWEEVLIMLPPHVRLVMLSATVPNFFEFSSWVGRIRQQPVYVQMTRHRPVPLEHSVFVPSEIFPIVTTDGTLDLRYYSRIRNTARNEKFQGGGGKDQGKKDRKQDKGKKQHKKGKTEDQVYKEFIKQLRDLEFLPCVVFAFSRDKVDRLGEILYQVDLLTDSERFKITKFAEKAVKRLNPVDRELPQILFVKELLSHGVGIHHSGILPILKEIVEILFSKGLLKVLVATETFAMGLNMPTRTVVFSALRKFDGTTRRDLLPGEYTQMSGRAGRRGKDLKGNVIMFFHEPDKMPPPKVIELITKAEPRKLESQFRIRYNQICNVMRSEELEIQDIARKSFLEDSSIQERKRNAEGSIILNKKVTAIQSKLSTVEGAADAEEFEDILQRLVALTEPVKSFGKKIQEGCIVEMIYEKVNLPAIVQKRQQDGLVVLAFDFENIFREFQLVTPEIRTSQLSIRPENVLFFYRTGLSKKDMGLIRRAQLQKTETEKLVGIVRDARKRKDCFSSAQSFGDKNLNLEERDELVAKLASHPFLHAKNRHALLTDLIELRNLQQVLCEIEEKKTQDELSFNEQINRKMNVLEQYNYINDKLVVQLKGRVLGVNNSPYGLVITECIFRGLWITLSPSELAGLLSVFVCHNKSKEEDDVEGAGDLPKVLLNALTDTKAVIDEIREIEETLQIQSEMEETLMSALVEVVYQWTSGVHFVDICKITDIKEGNIVTAILQLTDLARAIHNAAIILGDAALKEKLKALLKLVQRDIVFSTSLYVSK